LPQENAESAKQDFAFAFSTFFRGQPTMKLGAVIGRVTLSRAAPELAGARWLIVSPLTREHFPRGTETPAGLSKDPSLVVYDNLGGAIGQTIGYIEGREAAQPFDAPTPVDAINAALVDEIFYSPVKQ
jgi:microcompartment protein CcmK/EutM